MLLLGQLRMLAAVVHGEARPQQQQQQQQQMMPSRLLITQAAAV
jgi:hypothetical protein